MKLFSNLQVIEKHSNSSSKKRKGIRRGVKAPTNKGGVCQRDHMLTEEEIERVYSTIHESIT